MTSMTSRNVDEQAERSWSTDAALEVWQRRKWIGAAVFIAVAACAVTGALALPPLYRATTSVLVSRQQVSEEFVRSSVTTEFETRIQTIHQQVMSRERLTDLIGRLGLLPAPGGEEELDAAIERMRRYVRLELKGAETMSGRMPTIVFTLSYTGRDPQMVAHVANTLADSYIAENARSRTQQSAQTAEFLKGQLTQTKLELDAQEQRISDFKVRHGVELPEHFATNLSALERLNTQLRLNGEYQVRAMERRERLEEQLAATSAAPEAPGAATAETPLAKLKQELSDLQRRFSDRYPDVIRLKAEIASLEQQVANDGDAGNGHPVGTNGTNDHGTTPTGTTRRLTQSLEAADGGIATLKQQEAFLRKAIAGYEARIESAPLRAQEFQQLSLDYKTTKERYESLLKRYEEAQLADSLEQGQNAEQFRILDPALPPTKPAAPGRTALLALGLIAALAAAFGAVIASEKLDTSFHSIDDLRTFLEGPTLASIGLIVTDRDRWRSRYRAALIAVVFVVGVVALAAGTYYIALDNELIVRRIPGALR